VTDEARWWQRTTIYQVYPRSFADSDGDGIGDLRGVIDRLPVLAELGVGTVWLSPFFASPQEDFGYDISDYTAVAPEYGDVETVRELIEVAHGLGLRVVFDLVMNHTSDQHPWFVESASSRDNPKADWYLWHDGRGRPGRDGRTRRPNNWKAPLDLTSAWQWSPVRRQWFLASFLPFQPDLNWRNPEVREAVFGAARQWLGMGVDGFRLDVFGWIMKDEAFRSNPFRPKLGGGDIVRLWRRDFTENTPDNVRLAKDLRAVVDEFAPPERVLIGEVFGSPDEVHEYLGDDDGLSLTFAFDLLEYRYSARYFRDLIARYEANYAAPRLPAYVLENHDRSRTIDRVGGDEGKARLLATMLLTLRGVPTIYQGQEIATSNTYLPLAGALDPMGRTFLPWMPEWVSRRIAERINRDEVRTPMQWDASRNAGFSTAERTWLPVNPEYPRRNVAAQREDPDSTWRLFQTLIGLRRALPELHDGTLRLLDAGRDVVAYERAHVADDGTIARVVVVLNFGAAPLTWAQAGEVLVASGPGVASTATTTTVPASTGVVLRPV